MRFHPALKVTPIKLMNALRGDGAAFFIGKHGGNFLPRPAPVALFADEIHERFQAAVEGAPADGAFSFHRLGVVDDVWIHQRTV